MQSYSSKIIKINKSEKDAEDEECKDDMKMLTWAMKKEEIENCLIDLINSPKLLKLQECFEAPQ